MKKFIILFNTVMAVAIILMLSASSCEKDDEISGDSNLKIINKCSFSVTIYFDDTKLGRVSSDEDETWSVPSGTHTVKATSIFDQDEMTLSFISGQTRVITLTSKKNEVLFIESF